MFLHSCFLCLFLLSPSLSHASIIAFDTIVQIGKPVMLKAQTKGRFFPQRGVLVDFYVNEKLIGRTLSGGDGYAFFEYLPGSPGLKKVEAKTADDHDTGSMLVIKRNEKAILIEIEGGLFESLLSNKPRQGNKKAVKSLIKKYRIIYVTTMLGLSNSKKWLEDKELPSSVVLKYRGSKMFDELKELGLRLYAIIGSPNIMSEAPEYIKKRYSFKKTKKGEKVNDWDEVLKLLN